MKQLSLGFLILLCACPGPPTGSSDAGACVDACLIGANRCTGNATQDCVRVNGCAVWTDAVACTGGATCIDGRCASCDCTPGAKRCTADGPQTCTAASGTCGTWSAPTACATGAMCLDGACVACAGQAGTFSAQTVTSGSEARAYWLHVPAGYQCAQAWPLIVDFHGTAGGAETDPVEESYATDELIAVADAEHFIVARPRSRSAVSGATRIFQWDINPGDLQRNKTMALDLVRALGARYHLDPTRIYATGFSNGTNMASQFLGDQPRVFHGVGTMAGGLWNKGSLTALKTDPIPVYATTGYRDYMHTYQDALLSALVQAQLPPEKLFVRETDTGHEIYGWHFREAFRFLDQHVKPAAGALAAGWQRETLGSSETLLQLAPAGSGAVVASGTNGSFFRRAANGTWSSSGTVADQGGALRNITGLCIGPDGKGAATGEGMIALTADDGVSWTRGADAPEIVNQGFGRGYVMSVACAGGGVFTAGGFWSAVHSIDSGAQWTAASALSDFGFASQLAAVERSAAGTWLATGYYDYVGRSTDGVTFTSSKLPGTLQWYTDAASAPGGAWWVVGEHGTVLASPDDGATFEAQTSGTTEDLYAVSFADAQHGLTVGAHGTALYTANGGADWQNVSTGLDVFLGDVVWLDETHALVVGEHGTVLTFTAP